MLQFSYRATTDLDRRLTSFSQITGKIGLCGGTFDPIHNAHIAIAEAAQKEHKLDHVVFIPTAQNPFKIKGAVAAEHRLAMVRLAIEANPNFLYSSIEIERPSTSFTVATLRDIHLEAGQGSKFFWIVGSDCLPDLGRWKQIDSIFEMAEFIPVQRQSFQSDLEIDHFIESLSLEIDHKKALRANFVRMDPMNVSSTNIRQDLQRGQFSDLPKGVARYIEKNKLYI